MIDFDIRVQAPELNWKVIDEESRKLADDVGLHLQVQIQLALIRAKAIATGRTLKSITSQKILDSPSRGTYIRQIVGSTVLTFIQSGRRPGAKMPPEAAMVEWFMILNIPRRAWFPIRRAIARRGIRPRDILGRAMRNGRIYVTTRSKLAGTNIAAGLVKRRY